MALWERYIICRLMPGYTLETAGKARALEVRRLLHLVKIAADVRASGEDGGGDERERP